MRRRPTHELSEAFHRQLDDTTVRQADAELKGLGRLAGRRALTPRELERVAALKRIRQDSESYRWRERGDEGDGVATA